ncbi:MAG: RNA 2'-phosphotransferase [Planctomycetota bacterium]|nr:RNA 2'-phosphotransferase [Planctomycetota bacterium]
MDTKRATSMSKFLSLVLRHEPQRIGIALDDAGWTDVDALLAAAAAHGNAFSRDELLHVVATNDKKRFALSDDGTRIRASQGHSVSVELGYEAITPPETLYHGTATRFVESIRRDGLGPGERQHVHLSSTHDTAVTVGQRHGKPIVLVVRAGDMHRASHVFHQSANGVWLTASVPAEFLTIPA